MKTKQERNAENALKIIVLLMIAFIVIAFSSCSVSKKTTHSEVKQDSVSFVYKEKIVYKDSLVKIEIPADSSYIKAYYECDSLGQLQIRHIDELKAGHNVKTKIVVKDNYIQVECDVDSFFVYSIYSQRFEAITSDLSDVHINTVQDTETKRVIPFKYYVILFGAGIGCLVVGFVIGRFL